LPTDDRFKKLSYEQKNLLFTGFLELPTAEQMKASYSADTRLPRIGVEEEQNLKNLGYSDKSIDRIRDQLKLAGLES